MKYCQMCYIFRGSVKITKEKCGGYSNKEKNLQYFLYMQITMIRISFNYQ